MGFLLQAVKGSFNSTLLFIGGFLLGTIIDIAYYQLYKQWDPKEKNRWKLLTIVLIEIYTVVFILKVIYHFMPLEFPEGLFFNIGILTALLFLLKYTADRISTFIHRREIQNEF